MLPAAFQTPAAIVLLVGGLLSCFAGHRIFRIVLGIYGFIIGALIGSSLPGVEHTWTMVGAGAIGGLIGAVILIAAYFVGVALIGAGVGALAANAIWASFGSEPHIAVVILLAVAGALAALALQRYVIIAATAFGGAQTAVVGAAALLGDRVGAPAASASRTVYGIYPFDPIPATQWDVVAAIALGVIGLVVQLSVTAKGKKK
jgi:hypothetical protein